jgi:hypothetical protein
MGLLKEVILITNIRLFINDTHIFTVTAPPSWPILSPRLDRGLEQLSYLIKFTILVNEFRGLLGAIY